MKEITTYLNFDGTTRDAMTFYAAALGAKLDLQTFGDTGSTDPVMATRIMHARLTKGPVAIMASDTMPGMSFNKGNNFHVCIECSSADEIEKLFAAVGAGGTVTMPLADQFWGAKFGMLIDKFGIGWMFNHTAPKPAPKKNAAKKPAKKVAKKAVKKAAKKAKRR